MQQSALTGPVRAISHFCCHKSTFTSVMTGVENDVWPRKNLVLLSVSKRCAGRFSLGASGKEQMKITDWRKGREELRDKQSDGEERRSEGTMSQLTGRGAK